VTIYNHQHFDQFVRRKPDTTKKPAVESQNHTKARVHELMAADKRSLRPRPITLPHLHLSDSGRPDSENE
jgi:hypothetical protein